MEHGKESAYVRGCRCSSCTAIASANRANRRQRNREADLAYHRLRKRIQAWSRMSALQRATSSIPARVASEENISSLSARRKLTSLVNEKQS